MAVDRLNLGVIVGHDELSLTSPAGLESISIPMSQLKDYLSTIYTTGVPHDADIRTAAERAFVAGTALSTDDFLSTPTAKNLPLYLPNFLRLAIPMVEATEGLGGVMDHHMTGLEDGESGLTKEAIDDMTYGGGLFDMMTIAAAADLGISHPRNYSPTAQFMLKESMPEPNMVVTAAHSSPIDLLLLTPLATTEHRQAIAELRHKATQLAIDAEVNIARMNNIASSFRYE